ncbi:hypothetical protein BH11PLA2_BH11PLA2_03700 [soil metagenome]
MRIYVLKTLVFKEIYLHLANRSGLMLIVLLVAAAALLSVFDPGAAGGEGGGTGMVGGVHTCVIEYATETPLIKYLKASPTQELKIAYRDWESHPPQGIVNYPPGLGGIHLRTVKSATVQGREKLIVQIWHPKGDIAAMAPYEQWFYKTLRTYYQIEAQEKTTTPMTAPDTDDLWAIRESFRHLEERTDGTARKLPAVDFERQGLAGKVLDLRSAIAAGMVLFAIYFACVYLLPTMTCEERERSVLLAQALSPASPIEILAAKFIFYPGLGIGLAVTLAGIYKLVVLSNLFYWLSLIAVAAGYLGIGMTIATLAKTQRAAFMGGMCYLLSVALILLICTTNGIPYVQYFFLEFHGPRIIHAALSGEMQSGYWLNLAAAMGLGVAWMTAAAWLFRRRGWQ